MDKRLSVLQRGYWLLDRGGAQKSDVLGWTWCRRNSGNCPMNKTIWNPRQSRYQSMPRLRPDSAT